MGVAEPVPVRHPVRVLTTYTVLFSSTALAPTRTTSRQLVLIATTVQSVLVVAAPLVVGRTSDRTGRRTVLVAAAAVVFGTAMFVLAVTTSFAVSLRPRRSPAPVSAPIALVANVLPDPEHAAKYLGVANIAGALPYSIAPAVAPIVRVSGGYGALYP